MGCLKLIVVRVISTIILLALVIVAWTYRREIMGYIDAWRGHKGATYVPAAPAQPGADRGASMARLNERGGPAYQDYTAAQLATIISAALGGEGRRVFDSVQVALLENEVRVRGSLDTRAVPRSLLGPFASVLGDREPAAIGGPLSVDSTGRLMMTVTYFAVKDFPFPRNMIPRLLQAAKIPGASGSSVPIPTGTTLGDVRVSPEHVRFYRPGAR
jgi:hypothetical protein